MKTKVPFLYTSLLYMCAFILFLEWLYPVNQIGDVTNLTVFILYTIFCFFISILQVRWWISMPLKGFGLLFIIDSLFMTSPIFSGVWLQQFFLEVGFNLDVLFSQQWHELTRLFRSTMFLLLIWMLSYLLYYWFIVMKRVLIFILLTIAYLSVLDTFTAYNADAAIVRTFIISFLVLGITSFFKEIDKESIRLSWAKKAPLWIVPLISLVLFSALVGYASPKYDPQWPDPVPFLKSTADNAGTTGSGTTVRKVGYGDNDSRLGGSFIQDYTPVFQAAAKDDHYWRVETKDIYTGKGWEKSKEPNYQMQSDNQLSLETFEDSVETEEKSAIIDFQDGYDMQKLIYPYGVKQVETDQNVNYRLDRLFGEIRPSYEGSDVSLSQYTITYDKPSFAIDELRDVTPEDDSEEIKERFTQLPDSLPDRVGELALEVTEQDDNRYDKARAIESYFGQNGFTYQISNVDIPEENEDYVDQFLFDSKAGYCDNYSTSMVVMLRSLDIPARWAKGFTGGEIVENGDTADDYDIYEVTNSNAHSWVEVYFPGTGWVPFEPTQGFSNLGDFHLNMDESDQENTMDDPETEASEQPENTPEEDNAEASSSSDSSAVGISINWWYVLAFTSGSVLIAFVIYKTRFRWMTAYLSRKLENRQDAETFQEAYHYLMKLLAHKSLAKQPGETLREYAGRINLRYNTDVMSQLTHHYEQILYKNEMTSQQTAELSELWKNFMKQIMA